MTPSLLAWMYSSSLFWSSLGGDAAGCVGDGGGGGGGSGGAVLVAGQCVVA
jgi:hypothetical protein